MPHNFEHDPFTKASKHEPKIRHESYKQPNNSGAYQNFHGPARYNANVILPEARQPIILTPQAHHNAQFATEIDAKRASQISHESNNSNGSSRQKTQIGPWRLGKTLGRGSSGRVRLAKHAKSGKLAAIKIVHKSKQMAQGQSLESNEDDETFSGLSYGIEREIVIMKLIEHPSVMQLYDVWENRGDLYLVLEYVEGGELFDYLVSKGRLDEMEALKYFQQIISGVDYCHRFNICHRDLKPENLLLDKDKNIKIADFGMAALEPHGKLLETSCGSPHYASPEIVAGKNYHGTSSDIWSCGIILFALLTGHLPFDDDNIRNLLLKVKAGRFSMPSYLSLEAKDLIWRMLDVNPDTRIKMPDIISHPLMKKYRLLYKAPRPPSYSFVERPVRDKESIDPEILKSLMILWRKEKRSKIIEKLLSHDFNYEKQFYCLLQRYRQNHLENYNSTRDLASKASSVTKSASRMSLHRGHRRGESRSSVLTKSSSHRRHVSFAHVRRQAVQAAQQVHPNIKVPVEYLKYTNNTEKRLPTKLAENKRANDPSIRKVSEQFAAELDKLFNVQSSAALNQNGTLTEPTESETPLIDQYNIELDHIEPIQFKIHEDKTTDSYQNVSSAQKGIEHRTPASKNIITSVRPVSDSHYDFFHRNNDINHDADTKSKRATSNPEQSAYKKQTSEPKSKENKFLLFFKRKSEPKPVKETNHKQETPNNNDRANKQKKSEASLQVTEETAYPFAHNFFNKIFSIKPAQALFESQVDAAKIKQEILTFLIRWENKNVGISKVRYNTRNQSINVSIDKKNNFRLKPLKIKISILDLPYASRIVIEQVKGSLTSFNFVVKEFKILFSESGYISEEPAQLYAEILTSHAKAQKLDSDNYSKAKLNTKTKKVTINGNAPDKENAKPFEPLNSKYNQVINNASQKQQLLTKNLNSKY